MKTPGTRLGLLVAAAAILALPSAATAEPVIPPDNSAVTQYTEAFPTVGGDKDAGQKPKGGHSPTKALGSDNARKLRAQGPEGNEVAEVVATTAPITSVAIATGETGGDSDDAAAVGHRGNDNPGGGKAGDPTAGRADEVEGSSGLGEVISQATGSSSSGQMGAFLPLVIVATLASSLIFLLRKRRATGSRP